MHTFKLPIVHLDPTCCAAASGSAGAPEGGAPVFGAHAGAGDEQQQQFQHRHDYAGRRTQAAARAGHRQPGRRTGRDILWNDCIRVYVNVDFRDFAIEHFLCSSKNSEVGNMNINF